MVRKGIYRHNKVVTGAQDATKQVSKNEWNDDSDKTGMQGYASTTSNVSISSGNLTPVDTLTIVDAEGAPTTDILDNILTAETAIEDNLLLFADTGQTITVTHEATGAGQVHLRAGVNKILSETIPLLLIRRGADWYEFGAETFDLLGGDLDNIQNLIHNLSTATTALDFADDEVQTISISANTVFTGTGYTAVKSKVLRIITDGSLRTLTFPAGWVFVGAKPADQAGSKTGVLSLTCFGTLEADVVASYAVEA